MHKPRKSLVAALVVLVSQIGVISVQADCGASHASTGKNIVETAVAAGSFKTLAAALTAADLVDALQGSGPFTVFAPTDEAFSKLPSGTLDKLLKPENKDQLAAILTYHVVAGQFGSDKVIAMRSASTLNGQRIDLKVANGQVSADQARVVKTDINCSNGVIHVIDEVMLPSTLDIVSTAQSAGMFSTLVAAVGAAGLQDALKAAGPYTVFAPTDEAFSKLPAGTVESLLKPENLSKLQSILKYHVVPGRVFSDQAIAVQTANTLQDQTIAISFRDGQLRINDANLVKTDIDAANGVIHVIDTVLIPEDEQAAAPKSAQEIIHLAIERGVPQFNHGNLRACADIYELTVEGLLSSHGMGISKDGRQRLDRALKTARNTHSQRDKAWILRDAMDDMLNSEKMMLSDAR